jgi:hypothetical protein
VGIIDWILVFFLSSSRAQYSLIVGLGLPIFFAVVTGIWFTWGEGD